MQRSGGHATWPFTGRRPALEAFAEAHADPECLGFVAIGDSGVGTTRLVLECAQRAEANGVVVHRAWATPAALASPLAALAPILPAEVVAPGPADLGEVLRRAHDHFDGADPIVLVIDQLHLLDDGSATVVDHLLRTGVAFLIGSVTRGQPASDAVSGLWTSGRVRRCELAPLERGTVDTLLHRALGGAVDGEAAADLWAASEGSPLLLHELVDAAIASGALAEVDGVWRASGPLAVAGRAAELIERRLAALGDEAVAAMEVVLVEQPIGLSDLEAAVAPAVIDQLEAAHMITVTVDRRRTIVRIAHPATADVLRRRISPLRARRLATAAAAQVEAHGARRADDVLRTSRWLLDASAPVAASTLLAAARVARLAHDFATLERVARAAEREGAGAEATQLLGEALYELGRFAEAEATMAAPPVEPATDDERQLLATTRWTNLFWGLARPEPAAAVLEAAVASVSSAQVARSLVAQHASLTLYSGHPALALAMLPPIDPADRRAKVEAAFVLSPGLAVAGRTAEAVAVSDEGFAEHLALGELTAIAHPGFHMITKVIALTEAGRLAEAWELGRIGYDGAVEARVAVAKMWTAQQLGRIALLRGAPALAARWFREQVVHARAVDHPQPLRLGLSGVAISAAYLGDTEGSGRAIAELSAFDGAAHGWFAVEVVRARAWDLAAQGRTAEGRALLLPAADDAAATGQLTQEAVARYDHVRLGGAAAESAERLAELAAGSDSALTAAYATHVGGLARSDAATLVDAADRFEAMGALLLAAEATTAAADAFRRAGEQRLANAQTNRAATLMAQCEGATTPALVITTTVVPLTAREREIAYLVARGLQSKDIAEQLYLSIRTVHNHLQRVYGKLGVSSRADVGAALLGLGGER